VLFCCCSCVKLPDAFTPKPPIVTLAPTVIVLVRVAVIDEVVPMVSVWVNFQSKAVSSLFSYVC
jgi:hypothetical protein